MNKIGIKIKKALADKGMKQRALAEKIDVSINAVSKWVRTGNIAKENIPLVAKVLGLTISELVSDDENVANTSLAPDIKGFVPVISWVQAGEFTEAIEHNEAAESVPISVQKQRHTFALRVKGDSMMPDFSEGMLIVVEPDMEAISGDYVIAKNGGDATFKQLVKDGGDWYLKPLNSQYPTKLLDEAKIIGVVREAIRKFR